jgi:signal transduction histidine kinase
MRHLGFGLLLTVGLFAAQASGVLLVVAIAHWHLAARQEQELRDLAALAGEAVAMAGPASEDVLRRVRDANRLTAAFLVTVDGVVIADPSGIPAGSLASPLAVERAMLRAATSGERPVAAVRHPEEDLSRVATKVPAGILVLETVNRLPAQDRALLIATLPAMGLAAALALGASVLTRRWMDQRQRAARLATVGVLAASLAHEVKNPLGIVLSTAQVLADAPERNAEERDLLAGMIEEIRRADDHINGFLDLARDMPVRPQPTDFNQAVALVLALVKARARQSRVTVLVEDGPVVRVLADPRRLRQVLVNVLLNAIQAQPNGGEIRITLGTATTRAWCVIADAGPGIPQSIRRRLFEPFATGRSDGTGLGLWMVQRTIQAMGGTVEVECPTTGGTSVRIDLPCAS